MSFIKKFKSVSKYIEAIKPKSETICMNINDKTFVKNVFHVMLQREITENELREHCNFLNNGGSREIFIQNITSFEEFENVVLRSKQLHTERGIDLCFDIREYSPYEPKTVIDAGANVGQTTRYFRSNLPQADIFSFEPVKQTFGKLTNNTRNLDGVSCFNYALGSRDEKISIFYQQYSGWNSIPKNINQGLGSEIIEVRKLDDVMDEIELNHVDLLKIDTEGYELEVLRGAEKSLDQKKISFIFCEIGFCSHDIGHGYFFDLYNYLESKDYQVHAFYETNNLWHIPNRVDKTDSRFGFCNVLFVDNEIITAKHGPDYADFLRRLADENRDSARNADARVANNGEQSDSSRAEDHT